MTELEEMRDAAGKLLEQVRNALNSEPLSRRAVMKRDDPGEIATRSLEALVHGFDTCIASAALMAKPDE